MAILEPHEEAKVEQMVEELMDNDFPDREVAQELAKGVLLRAASDSIMLMMEQRYGIISAMSVQREEPSDGSAWGRWDTPES